MPVHSPSGMWRKWKLSAIEHPFLGGVYGALFMRSDRCRFEYRKCSFISTFMPSVSNKYAQFYGWYLRLVSSNNLKISWSSVSIVELETILCPCIFCSLCLSLCQHTKCLGKQWIWIWYLHWENMFKAMSFSLIQVLAKIGFTVTSIVLAVTSIICYTLIINLVTFYIPLLL